MALKSSLESASKFPEVQRLFDLWSWQAFVSLNWPTDPNGNRQAANSTEPPAWTLWTNSTRVFLPHGAPPPACKPAAELAAAPPANLELMLARGLPTKIPAEIDTRRVRLLAVTSAVNSTSALAPLNDIKQAFSGPIIDQNGNYVYYEILIDKNELDYICQNKLYSVAGQEDFAKTHSAVDLPSGVDTQDASGAYEIKLAWKILTASDEVDRYLTEEAQFPTPSAGGAFTLAPPVKVGLVGMHIAHKSVSSKQWIWSTFEQVDNLEVDAVAHPNLKPSFFDPSCAICVIEANVGSVVLKRAAMEGHIAETSSRPLMAQITLTRPDGIAGAREFDVLVNAPEGVTQVAADSPYYAGTFAFFGPMMHGMRMASETTFAVPLPHTLQAFAGLAETTATKLNIRVVPSHRDGAPAPALKAVSVGAM